MSTHNIWFHGEIRKIYINTFWLEKGALSKAMSKCSLVQPDSELRYVKKKYWNSIAFEGLRVQISTDYIGAEFGLPPC